MGVLGFDAGDEDAAALCMNFIVSSLEDMPFGVVWAAILSIVAEDSQDAM